jgi:hypothetical protein
MCSRESLLGAWIDPWMCSLVVDDVSPYMCSRAPGCVPGNPCSVLGLILGCVPWWLMM